MKNTSGTIIYIGKAKSLKNRVSQYFLQTNKSVKVNAMVANIATFDYILTNTELEALNLEANLIKQHQPYYNILLKDGKAHPFLVINTKNDFPTIDITRKVRRDGKKYFGPYFGCVNARDLLTIVNSVFNIRTCKLNLNNGKTIKRECIYYHMGLCDAPCTAKISKLDYAKNITNAVEFLKGDTTVAKTIISNKMLQCAKTQNFERAIEYRNYLSIIENLNARLITELNSFADIDVFGYATNGQLSVVSALIVRAGKTMGLNNYFVTNVSDDQSYVIEEFLIQYYNSNNIVPTEIVVGTEIGDVVNEHINQISKVKITTPKIAVKKQLLELANRNALEHLEKNLQKEKLQELKTTGAIEQLQQRLNLPELPIRIEGFDISNISGTNMVASMVVFTNGQPNYSHYRKFKIKTVDGSNDFECMREVLARRINELQGDDVSFSTRPNLILIDGGKGQLSFANSVINDYGVNIPIISLAKKEEEIFRPNNTQSVKLSKDNYALKLLQNVRDESHRFAITFHRSLRGKKALVSELSKIDLIGKAKEIALFEYFKDINKIKNSSIEELMCVDGISKKLATNIFNHFKK